MRILNRKKEFSNSVKGFFILLLSVGLFSANAQERTDLTIGEMERIQDQDMDYLKQIHKIIKNYPSFSYSYSMNDGNVEDVTVTGVDNSLDRKRLEVVIFDLKSNMNMVKNRANRVGVFYSVDEPAEYQGEVDRAILSNLKYPEDAKDWGVEGTIFVKFVVDDDGEIPFATTSSNIETSMEFYLEDLEEQAVSAVEATSGDWEPAQVEGTDVSSLVVVPVTFDFEKNPMLPALIR
jgi:TonB family protein